MECKYLYIDDAPSKQANGTISGLAEEGTLSIEHDHPEGSWDEQIQYIIEKVSTYKGLILDLRLDQGTSKNGSQSNYRGTSIAQELRILTREKKVEDLPIILLSAEGNLINYFDSTGDDLFDLIVSKETISAHFDMTKRQLIALAEGYPILRGAIKETTISSLVQILGLSEDEFVNIDPRFLAKLIEMLSTAHGFSNFFINQVLKRNGVLIDERTLAARLGVDIDNAIKPPNDFRTIKASERVKLLTNYCKTELTPAKPYKYANSDCFWDVCVGSGQPLDIMEGILVTNQDALFPWQDRKYVSIYSALHRENVHKWTDVAALDKPKLEKLKILFGRGRSRR